MNTTAGAPRIRFTPTPQEDGAYIQVFYLRNANWLTLDADVLDIPEAANYIIQCVKVRVYEKEGDPRVSKAMEDQKAEWADTVATLQEGTADENNEIEPDLSAYHEME